MPTHDEQSAGFAVRTYTQRQITDNAREKYGSSYGDPQERMEMVRGGFVNEQGAITVRGWKTLNEDIRHIERNAVGWLKKNFLSARDEGHGDDELVGTVWYRPTDKKQTSMLMDGVEGERLDLEGYKDLWRDAWAGVSEFGQSVLGGEIVFFDFADLDAASWADKRHGDAAPRWKRYPGIPNVQAPLSGWGHYTISHRQNNHTVSYRPPGHHVHVGSFPTEAKAKNAAHYHAKLSPKQRLVGDSSLSAMRGTSRGAHGNRKSTAPATLLRMGSRESFEVPPRAWKHFYDLAVKDIARAKKLVRNPAGASLMSQEWASKTEKQTPEEVAAGTMRYIEMRANMVSASGYPIDRVDRDLWVRLGGKLVPRTLPR